MASRPKLTELQLAVLRSLWTRGEARVADVHADLSADRKLAPTTVATLLARLESRGLVTHRVAGRQFVYAARVGEQETRAELTRDLTAALFDGDVSRLVSHLLSEHELAPGDVRRIKRLIEERERAAEEAE